MTGDTRVRQQITKDHMDQVRFILRNKFGTPLRMMGEDLEGAAFEALVRLADNYDPAIGTFGGYVETFMPMRITDIIRSETGVRAGRQQSPRAHALATMAYPDGWGIEDSIWNAWDVAGRNHPSAEDQVMAWETVRERVHAVKEKRHRPRLARPRTPEEQRAADRRRQAEHRARKREGKPERVFKTSEAERASARERQRRRRERNAA